MSIQDKFNRANVIYKITKDIDLGGETLTIPEGCTLDFQGGSFSNGTITLNNTRIDGEIRKCFDVDVKGTIANDCIYAKWFDFDKEDFTESYIRLVNIANEAKLPIKFEKKEYHLNNDVDGVVCSQSIDFNDATIILDITTNYCRLKFTNSPYQDLDSSVYEEWKTYVDNNTLKIGSYKNKVVKIKSSETEARRYHELVVNDTLKSEMIYVDKDGQRFNDFYNDTINEITSVQTMDCNASLYIKNLNLVLNDLYTGAVDAVEYRRTGLWFEQCTNISFENITFSADIQNTRNTYIHFYDCFNVSIKNVQTNNTRLDSSVVIRGDKSAYVFIFNYILNLYCERVNTSAYRLSTWSATGSNYVVNQHWNYCNIRAIDNHYRGNNITVTNSNIASSISAHGWGRCFVSNCNLFSRECIATGGSYGTGFYGDIIVRDCKVYTENTLRGGIVRVGGGRNFDYKVSSSKAKYICRSITIDNVYVECNKQMMCVTFEGNTSDDETFYPERAFRLFPKISVNNVTINAKEEGNIEIIHYDPAYTYLVEPNQKVEVTVNNYNYVYQGVDMFSTPISTIDRISELYNEHKPIFYLNISNSKYIDLMMARSTVVANLINCVVRRMISSKTYLNDDCVVNLYNCEITPYKKDIIPSSAKVYFYNCLFKKPVEEADNYYNSSVNDSRLFNNYTAMTINCLIDNELADVIGFRGLTSHNAKKRVKSRYSTSDITYKLSDYYYTFDAWEITSNNSPIIITISLDELLEKTTRIPPYTLYFNTCIGATVVIVAGEDTNTYYINSGFEKIDITYNNATLRTVKAHSLTYRHTSNRPNLKQGEYYFDTDLKKPVWWDGSKWVDATGTEV